MEKSEARRALSRFIIRNRRICTLVAIGLCGILLMLCAIPSFGGEIKETAASESTSAQDYAKSLEARLSETLSAIQGAGKSSVFITLDSSYETVYASNAKLDETTQNESGIQKTTEKQLATTQSQTTGETPIVVKQLCPKIKGVLIVCEGGNNDIIKQNVASAASVALNISSSRIYVTGGNYSQ